MPNVLSLADEREAAASSTLPAGQLKIGRYTLLGKLGEGGMGVVYSAFDEELDRRVALKVVRGRTGEDSIGRARMHREAQAMAQISHPNVVQVHDVGRFEGQVFLAMEYVRGETLSAWQRRQDPYEPAGRRRVIDMYIQAGEGLRAAHERGLIHRDFKPDNVLVGEDGRPRVLDFGLAASREEGGVTKSYHVAVAELRRSGTLDDDLTRTGAIMGTPAYMAPEQFLARPTDARTDQFSFCVALYEALYGESPFPGETFLALRDAVTAGAPGEPGDVSHVPGWLRAVLLRGLARAPVDRFPSMGELLAALAHDPDAARRARRRTLAAFALVAVASALVIVGGLRAWAAWQARRYELDAQQRLAALRDALVLEQASGADADRLLRAFVEDPLNQGTRALGQAWLQQAAREEASGAAQDAVDAYAAAYTVATDEDDQRAALVGLARFFREHRRLVSLVRAVATLERQHPSARPDPEELELRLDAQIARGDLLGAAALLDGPLRSSPRAGIRGLLVALAPATQTELTSIGTLIPVDTDGDGVGELLGARVDQRELVLVPATPTLGPAATFEGLENHRALAFTPGPGERSRVIVRPPDEGPDSRAENAVMRREGERFVTELRWVDSQVKATLVHDLDGDGAPEIYLGTGPFSRRLLELRPNDDDRDDASAWTMGQPAPSVDRRRSDVLDLVAGDLDGDGRAELVAGLGAWSAYELQVLRRDPGADALTLVTRRKLGQPHDTMLARRGDAPPAIFVLKTDEYANDVVFPADRPFGEPAGLYRFELRGGALETIDFTADPPLQDDGYFGYEKSFVGDLDGDGRDEFIATRRRRLTLTLPPTHVVELFTPLPDGRLERLLLVHARAVGAHDLDGDGDDELIVELTGRGEPRTWVLGAGSSTLPPLPSERALVASDAPDDPRLAAMWEHANELAAMGLGVQAAEAFETIESASASDPDAARALLNAARLREELGDDVEASALYHRAMDDRASADERLTAAEGAARCQVRRGEYAAALADLERALASPSARDGDAAVRLARRRDELDELLSAGTTELRFDAPLVDWRLDQPHTLERDGATETLHVDAINPGPLASIGAAWDGGLLELSVDLELDRAEWNSRLEFVLTPNGVNKRRDPEVPVELAISSRGGSVDQLYHFTCAVNGRLMGSQTLRVDPRADAGGLGRLQLRVIRDPVLEEMSCIITRASGEAVFYGRDALHAKDSTRGHPAGYRLEVRSGLAPVTWTAARLHSITLRGATVIADADAPDDYAVRERLVESDPNGALLALAALEPTPERALWRALALAELGRLREAIDALAPLVSAPTLDAGVRRTLLELLRTRPELLGAIIRESAGVARYTELLVEAWSGAHQTRPDDPLPVRVLSRGLADLERRGLGPRELLELLSLRASVLAHSGQEDDARRDRERALALLEDPALAEQLADVANKNGVGAQLRFELARDAARRGDVEAARALLDEILKDDDLRLQFVDRIAARPELRSIQKVSSSPSRARP
ncbi:MAG: protein kinase [Myxococcales bacterium]|nr:protein kinase [Myxococcales bacterium]